MRDPLVYPKLRWPIDLRLDKVGDRVGVIVSCPLGITPRPIFVIAAAAPVLSCFDGKHSITEIAGKFAAHGLTSELVGKLAAVLEQNYFLESPRFTEAHEKTRLDFARAKLRRPALAGNSYSAAPGELAAQIDGYLSTKPAAGGSPVQTTEKGRIVGLIAPHIDYHRGSASYGITYNRLRQESHDLYVIIGIAHQYSKYLFHLTAKDFGTPLGVAPCDFEFVSKLAGSYGTDRSFADEILHMREHSIELQIPFLQCVNPKARIAPILMGSLHHMLEEGRSPAEFDEYQDFVVNLAACISERASSGQKVCLIAAADMAHVGRAFGDACPLDQARLQKVAERDGVYLNQIKSGRKSDVLAHIAEDRDARRLCGFPAVYTLMDVLDRTAANYSVEVIDYRQAVDYGTDCAVSFAGIGFYTT